MNLVVVVGLTALVLVTVVMVAAIVASNRANYHRARAASLEGVLRDALVDSLSGDEVSTRRKRMEAVAEYDRVQMAPYIDGGF